MTRVTLDGPDWRVLGLVPGEAASRRVGTVAADASTAPWIPATVPGDVQSDLVDAGVIPDPFVDLNSRGAEWTSARDWVYERHFAFDEDLAGRAAVLCFDGVDYACEVWLNGIHLGGHRGMFDAFEFPITDHLLVGTENRLVVVVEHAPGEPDVQAQMGWTSQVRLWKPRFAYGWDFCTRLVPVGIWGGVRIDVHARARLTDVWLQAALSADLAHGTLDARVEVEMEGPGGTIRCEVLGPGGERVTVSPPVAVPTARGEVRVSMDVLAPAPWFPNGNGPQDLYTVITILSRDGEEVDRTQQRVGFRTIQMVAGADAPEGALPYQLLVNGTPQFILGWNWVPVSQLYGRPHEQKYRHLLALARHAGCNMLRVWGGGILERPIFYELCDEYGIMVWQEFIQSSSGCDSEPATDAEYQAHAEAQARAMVRARRNHTSLVLWTAGNELSTSGNQFSEGNQPITLEHPNVAALRHVAATLDPGRAFLPSSPSGPCYIPTPGRSEEMHDVHGNWLFMGDGDHYRFYDEIDPLLHSEFGVEGVTNVAALQRSITGGSRWPGGPGNSVWDHRAGFWNGRRWIHQLFGEPRTLEQLAGVSQWLQAEGLRYAIEARRRREGHCAGVLPWQYNEPWPNAACTNAVDFFGHPKAAYWAVRDAYAQVLASARYPRLAWPVGETARWEVFANGLPAGRGMVDWRILEMLTGTILGSGQLAARPSATGGGASPAGSVEHRFECEQMVVLELTVEGGSNVNQYFASSHPGPSFAGILEAPRAGVIVRGAGMDTKIEVGRVPLLGARLDAVADEGGVHAGRGYWMYVAPGSTIEMAVLQESALSAINLSARTLPFASDAAKVR